MAAQLRLAYINPHPVSGRRFDGPALHRLAELLIEHVQSGSLQLAHGRAVSENLDPLGVAVVSTWMSKAGLREDQILEVMVGHAAAMESAKAASAFRKRCRRA